jgi:phosphoribosyl 1,2-cyclic phosphodiesterase
VRIKIWGARGSVPSPGPETVRYGGNTSCVQVTLDDGTILVLDAGTGIRNLGISLADTSEALHILLTHLHMDHIQGLVFFSPLFTEQSNIAVWGPAGEGSLQDRIARYISAPLSPVEVRELPSCVSFCECPRLEWEIGSARVQAQAVTHRGPTLGYRITEGDTSLCYIPDHEPALGPPLEDLEPEWISGFDLAKDASLLIHDSQYADSEYAAHAGWGHSAVSDTVVFAHRVAAKRLMLFHHDPLRSDDRLDTLFATAIGRWSELGHDPAAVEMAVERRELELEAMKAPAEVGAATLTTRAL